MRPLPSSHTRPWSVSAFPAHLDTAIKELRNLVIDRVGPDGSVHEPCESRPLETALTLRLLERTGQASRNRLELARYLASPLKHADGLDQAVTHAATNSVTPLPNSLLDELVRRTPAFTSDRKRAMLDGIFKMLGAPVPDRNPSNYFRRDGLHSWAAVQVTAIKAIFTEQEGGRQTLDDEDIRILLETQRTSGVWEGNLLIHLCVLHALSQIPGTRAVVADGIRKALAHQRIDGGMPFVTDTDTWCTVTAGIALSATGAPTEVLHRVASHLVDLQQPGGGWSYTDSALQTDVDDTSVALQFLQSFSKHTHREAIRRGTASLLSVRNPGGGFPTYVAASPPEACMTAAALDALTPQWERHKPVIDSGLAFLARQQNGDGSFPPDWSSSQLHTLFRALLVVGRRPDLLTEDGHQVKARAMDLVRERQNSDGGWGQEDGRPSDPISTAYGLIALCGQDDPVPAVRAVRYLLQQQRADGSIPSVSDSVGPRPFLFRVAILADIFVLLAWGHVMARLGSV